MTWQFPRRNEGRPSQSQSPGPTSNPNSKPGSISPPPRAGSHGHHSRSDSGSRLVAPFIPSRLRFRLCPARTSTSIQHKQKTETETETQSQPFCIHLHPSPSFIHSYHRHQHQHHHLHLHLHLRPPTTHYHMHRTPRQATTLPRRERAHCRRFYHQHSPPATRASQTHTHPHTYIPTYIPTHTHLSTYIPTYTPAIQLPPPTQPQLHLSAEGTLRWPGPDIVTDNAQCWPSSRRPLSPPPHCLPVRSALVSCPVLLTAAQ